MANTGLKMNEKARPLLTIPKEITTRQIHQELNEQGHVNEKCWK
jgi:hypothetical protein